jgi:hypothetical protein
MMREGFRELSYDEMVAYLREEASPEQVRAVADVARTLAEEWSYNGQLIAGAPSFLIREDGTVTQRSRR